VFFAFIPLPSYTLVSTVPPPVQPRSIMTL
jgi:hypothetical protein